MEILGGIEPELELHFPVPLPLRVHVGVEGVGISGEVAEELEVDLVVRRPLRGQLQKQIKNAISDWNYDEQFA